MLLEAEFCQGDEREGDTVKGVSILSRSHQIDSNSLRRRKMLTDGTMGIPMNLYLNLNDFLTILFWFRPFSVCLPPTHRPKDGRRFG